MPPLPVFVFVVGTGTLGAEIAAVRLLAPYFGASTVVWANTIGVVLVALSIGYWLGGRFADRHPDGRSLCLLTLVAALLLAAVPFAADPFLDLAVGALDSVSAGAFVGSLIGVLGLLAVPILLLGAVSPWAIRLAVNTVEEAGEVAGRLYALSTAGSLVGTLLSALLLIPAVGTRRTFLIFALAIAVVAVMGLRPVWRYAAAPVAIALAMLIPVGTLKAQTDTGGRVIHEADTEYQYARVIERDDGSRRLELNEGQAVHSLYRPETVLTGDYWDGLLVLPFLSRSEPPRRMAILGNAAGTTARAYGRLFPSTRIDGVELDSELSAIGRRYFDMRNPRLTMHHEDARPYLRRVEDEVRRDRGRRLPPALHPVLPDHRGVLRAGARPADPRRRGHHQRGPARGRDQARARAHRRPAHRVRQRGPRPDRGHQHAAGGGPLAAVGAAPERRDPRHAARAAPHRRARRRRGWCARSQPSRPTPTTAPRSSGWWTSRSWTTRPRTTDRESCLGVAGRQRQDTSGMVQPTGVRWSTRSEERKHDAVVFARDVLDAPAGSDDRRRPGADRGPGR